MPTPFTHLASAQVLLADGGLPPDLRARLQADLPAFLLGSIAADGHGGTRLRREDTHFYRYDQPISSPLPAVMLSQYPELAAPTSAEQRAFVAGYVGHLALDEVWTEAVMRPYFIEPVWGNSSERFLALNLLLIGMDERDRANLQPAFGEVLPNASPAGWLPFLPDEALRAWRDIVARQLAPGAASETLDIISARTHMSATELDEMAHSPAVLDERLWAHIPHAVVTVAIARMHAYAAEQVAAYLRAR